MSERKLGSGRWFDSLPVVPPIPPPEPVVVEPREDDQMGIRTEDLGDWDYLTEIARWAADRLSPHDRQRFLAIVESSPDLLAAAFGYGITTHYELRPYWWGMTRGEYRRRAA